MPGREVEDVRPAYSIDYVNAFVLGLLIALP
jgi:hypothetical protein